MVDATKLKPGDKVVFRKRHHGQVHIDSYQTSTGKDEPLDDGHVFTVADPAVSRWGRRYVMLESPLGKNGVIECSVDFLDECDPVEAIHAMRSAGPPAPASCRCDIMSLMRVGCRCGYLAKERGASS